MFHYFIIGWLIAITCFYQLANRISETQGLLLAIISLMIVVYALRKQISYRTAFSATKVTQLQLYLKKLVNLVAGLIIGLTWAFWQSFFSQNLPNSLLNQHLLIQAEIIDAQSIQAVGDYRQRQKLTVALQQAYAFDFTEASERLIYQAGWLTAKVQLSLYADKNQMPIIKTGETWLFAAKLKAPYASQNPFAKDYETYLFQQGIQAKGYLPQYSAERLKILNQLLSKVTKPKINVNDIDDINSIVALKLTPASHWNWRYWRQSLQTFWQDAFVQAEFWRIYQALLLGERSQMTADDWHLFQQTGTSHLMAISGLHLAIMALLGAGLFRLLWWLGGYRIEYLNLPVFSAFGAALLATAYLLISGMAIPTLRAWIMVMAFLLFIFIRRKFQPWSALAIAVFLVLLIDSRAVLSSGFWLSFLAVALIFYSLPWLSGRSRWQQLLILQLVLTVGLAPVLIWQFSQLPTLSFLANIVAIPLVSFIALPLLFFTAVVALLSHTVFNWFMPLNDWVWQSLWRYLQWLQHLQSDLPFNNGFAEQSLFWVFAVYASLLLSVYLLRKRKQWRTLSAQLQDASSHSQVRLLEQRLLVMRRAVIISLFLWGLSVSTVLFTFQAWQRPPEGEFWLTLFDSGQGLAVAVETAEHRLIYDTGPKWGKTSAAQFSIIPYWQKMGNPRVDLLMVSHSDNDHAGGVADLLSHLPINEIISGQPIKVAESLDNDLLPSRAIRQCHQGQTWIWDGVRFEVLAPLQAALTEIKNDNDFSCVLNVSSVGNPQHSVLITGDVGHHAEAALIASAQAKSESLQAAILLAGHHGSRYSSSEPFLQAVVPQFILFSAGYQNHFGFPSDQVLQRITTVVPQTQLLNTACSGALTFALNAETIELRQQTRKTRSKWYYQHCKQGIK